MKDFCDSLSPEQLEKKVVIWREDEAISKMDPVILESDQYIADDMEGCVDEDEAKYIVEFSPDDYPNGMADFKKVYEKGHPILMEDF